MDGTTGQLNSLIQQRYNALDESGAIEICPEDLADEVLRSIDPSRLSPILVGAAATLELRQLARDICRQRQVLNESETEQSSLFELQLQKRYPAERRVGSREIRQRAYVLRDHLTLAERWANINRLYSEATAKTAHADALKAETQALIEIGRLESEKVSL